LNPFTPFGARRRNASDASKLYGAIVARARLPVFYQQLGIPDTLEGRFLMLALHLFIVQHRLTAEDDTASALAQDLADRFSADMETVLREIGVGDLGIPKKVRGVAAAGASLLETLERALRLGDDAVVAVLRSALPPNQRLSEVSSLRLAHYVRDSIRALEAESVAALVAADVKFAEPSEAPYPGKDEHD
jgi:cytochrome b pre-mRNA-processing protein 3